MTDKATIAAKLVTAATMLGSLGCIWWGAWMIYKPAAPIAVGLLLWVDLTLGSFRK